MIIPDDRLGPWQGNVGVPGGIPTRSTIYKNIVTDLGADPTGSTDCSDIIHDAIAACPSGQIVYIPAGTFRLSSRVYLANLNSMTLRGAGMGVTTLKPDTGIGTCILFGSQEYPPPTTDFAITAGATKGSNTITMADASTFVVDQPMIILTSPMPVWGHILGGYPDTSKNLRITFKVRSKTSTTVTFDPPCPFDFSTLGPRARALKGPSDGYHFINGIGIEDMTFDLSGTNLNWAFEFDQTWGCWVTGVEINAAYSRQARFGMFVAGELRGCYTHDTQGSGSNHEGLDFDGDCCWNLVENNIADKGGASPIQFGDSNGGCACNVVAYNYCTNTDAGFWDISFNHNPHNMLNLAEGNIIDYFKDDGYFGSSSHNTLFRNRITLNLELKHLCNYYNIVGNVLGSNGYSDAYETTTVDYSNSPVYALGYPNIGNHHYVGTFGPTTPPDYSALTNELADSDNQKLDLNVAATIIRHGNFDYFNDDVVWDGGIADHTIPDSLYLSAKPDWWGDVIPWPSIGSDLSPIDGTIPAKLRFEGGGGGAGSDVPSKSFFFT